MKANVSGLVMELKEEYDEKKNRLATVTVMIFQKGEKELVAVKKVPSEIIVEGENVNDLPVRVSPYNFDGRFGVSTVYVG